MKTRIVAILCVALTLCQAVSAGVLERGEKGIDFTFSYNDLDADYFRRLQAQGVLRDFDPESGAKAFLGAFCLVRPFLGVFLRDLRKSAKTTVLPSSS